MMSDRLFAKTKVREGAGGEHILYNMRKKGRAERTMTEKIGGGRRVNVSGHCQLRDPWLIQQLSHSHNTRINCHPAHFDTR